VEERDEAFSGKSQRFFIEAVRRLDPPRREGVA